MGVEMKILTQQDMTFELTFLVLLSTIVASINTSTICSNAYASIGPRCCDEMRKIGINMMMFPVSVAHGVHSISVEHIKHFFGVDIPVENGIPTVNTDLTGPPILPYAPKISNDTKMLSLTMKELNYVLSNNDKPDNFYVKGLSSIEQMTHIAHMDEMWFQAHEMYDTLKINPPSQFACNCITDENNNGIKRALVLMSRKFRESAPIQQRLTNLTNSKNWKIWKNMMNTSMMSKHGIYNFSTYMYCKL